MAEEETELAMVQRHVRKGAEIVARQRELLARLQVDDYPTEKAEVFLRSFEGIQRQHEEHLARLIAKVPPSRSLGPSSPRSPS